MINFHSLNHISKLLSMCLLWVTHSLSFHLVDFKCNILVGLTSDKSFQKALAAAFFLYMMFDQKVDELCCGHSFILVVRFLLGNAVPRLAEAPPHLAECLRESEKLSRNEVSPFFARLDFSCSLHRLKPAFMMIILMKRLVLADLHHRKFFFFFIFGVAWSGAVSAPMLKLREASSTYMTTRYTKCSARNDDLWSRIYLDYYRWNEA